MAEKKEVQEVKQELSYSEHFTNKVLKEFGHTSSGDLQVTDYQRTLVQGYFIQIDRALKMAEDRRVKGNSNNKDHKYDNNDPINWNTVDLRQLAVDVMHYARIGLDMAQDNMLTAIPYKDNNRVVTVNGVESKMYTVNLMKGYNGIRFIAEKYALDKPKAVTTELVYSTDVFKPIKKNSVNNVEGYEFEITNAFDRGEIVGGFGYIEFDDQTKNKLVILTKKDIEKRKPKYASAEFWGGTKKEWQNGKQIEVATDGWLEEMCLKTIKRAVYSPKNIPIDPKKIDDEYQYSRQQELKLLAMEQQQEQEKALDENVIDMPYVDATPEQISEKTEDAKSEQAAPF